MNGTKENVIVESSDVETEANDREYYEQAIRRFQKIYGRITDNSSIGFTKPTLEARVAKRRTKEKLRRKLNNARRRASR